MRISSSKQWAVLVAFTLSFQRFGSATLSTPSWSSVLAESPAKSDIDENTDGSGLRAMGRRARGGTGPTEHYGKHVGRQLRANGTYFASINDQYEKFMQDATNAKQLAESVNNCPSSTDWLVVWPHKVDIVISQKHKLVYIDIVKAASSTIRSRLRRVLKAGWGLDDLSIGCAASSRMTTACLDSKELAEKGYVVFSFVRSPYQKYLSGIEQVKHQEVMRTKRGQKNQELMVRVQRRSLNKFDEQRLAQSELGLNNRNIIASQKFRWEQAHMHPTTDSWSPYSNEHLQSNMWRLKGLDKRGKPLKVDFIGQVENFDDDWQALVYELARLGHINQGEAMELLEPMKEGNSRPRVSTEMPAMWKKDICNMPDIQWDLYCLRNAKVNYTCP